MKRSPSVWMANRTSKPYVVLPKAGGGAEGLLESRWRRRRWHISAGDRSRSVPHVKGRPSSGSPRRQSAHRGQAQHKPDVKAFQIHRSLTEPEKFFFYEGFPERGAIAEHHQTSISRR